MRLASLPPSSTPALPPSCKPSCASIRPLGTHERYEQEEEERHIPEVELIHDRHAVLRHREILDQRRNTIGSVELPARLVGDALEQRRAHLGVYVLGIEI